MSDETRARLNELLAQRRYVAAVAAAAEQLATLGLNISRDDAVSKEAVQVGLDAGKDLDKCHLVWHRVWGVRLRSEVIEATRRLADHLDGEQATLIWGHSPAVGFVAPVASVLRSLPAHIGPEPSGVGPGGVGSDLLLVADGGQSGLRLEYNHYANADEYELRPWGRYAVSLCD